MAMSSARCQRNGKNKIKYRSLPKWAWDLGRKYNRLYSYSHNVNHLNTWAWQTRQRRACQFNLCVSPGTSVRLVSPELGRSVAALTYLHFQIHLLFPHSSLCLIRWHLLMPTRARVKKGPSLPLSLAWVALLVLAVYPSWLEPWPDIGAVSSVSTYLSWPKYSSITHVPSALQN